MWTEVESIMDHSGFQTPATKLEVSKLGHFPQSEGESDYVADMIMNYQSVPDAETTPQPLLDSTSGTLTNRAEKRNASVAFKDDNPNNSGTLSKKVKATTDDDPPLMIAHCPAVCKLMDEKKLSWGVRFEIARLISKGLITARDITPAKLDLLKGSNKESAPRVPRVFANASDSAESVCDPALERELAANSPWEELDREHEALSFGPYEGIGNNPRLPDWYGGKVMFQGRLLDENGKYRIVLDDSTLGGSSRLTRRFGSWSFLRIRVPHSIFFGHKKDYISFFLRPFVIWGRVFRVFDAKDGKVLLYWTNENLTGNSLIPDRMSFERFIEWHNPLEENQNQLMTKWAARMSLGLSTSIPGPRLLPEDIFEQDDIVSKANSDMTDGCGLSSKYIHYFLSNLLGLHITPSAFQFRLAGYKGMSLIRTDDLQFEHKAQAWFRPSQRKIKYANVTNLDPAQLTFDILRISHMRTPAQLSTEVLINLAENGVPADIFVRLLVDSIRTTVKGLITWEGHDAMMKLFINVERAGGVTSARRARESISEARVRGYTNKSPDELDLEHDDDDDDEDDDDPDEKLTGRRSTAWWTDYVSGCPSSLEETVMHLLDSGFTPQESPILREKLRQIVISKIKNRSKKLRFEVEESCIAFAVPDPFCVLGENEVQIKSSKRNLKMTDGLLTDTVLGDVLVTRNPCKVPTDVRKVKAVEHHALRNFVDVIVFSVRGQRRLIDFLAGGDYDGDKVLAIWKDTIVSPFQNADEKYATEPNGMDVAFERDQETVADFLSRTARFSESERRKAMQKYLLGPLVDPSIRGKYSNMHINAMYNYGYANPRTVKLAYKFCRVLDGPKTGWRIAPKTFVGDQNMYSHRGPEWKELIGNKKAKPKTAQSHTSNQAYLKRGPNSRFIKGPFVMDVLIGAANREKDKLLTEMKQIFAPLTKGPDPDLILPWDNLHQWAERGPSDWVKMKRMDLSKIAIHVKDMYRMHSKMLKPKQGHFTHLSIEDRQDKLRKVSKAFSSGPPPDELPTIVDKELLARYRASYAYKYDIEQQQDREGWSRFPFNVAMRELCGIKAQTTDMYKVVKTSFYERFKLLDRG